MTHSCVKTVDALQSIENCSRTVCPICLDTFRLSDQLYLIAHAECETKENLKSSHHRKHIVHVECMDSYKLINKLTCVLCPYDREIIDELIETTLSDLIKVHISEFPSYYRLIKHDLGRISQINNTNLDIPDQNGKTLLYCASQLGHLPLVRKLLRRGGDPSIGDRGKFTPLMAAVAHGHIEIAKTLINYNRNLIEQHDIAFRLSIDIAAHHQHHQCVVLLLNSGNYEPYIYSRILKRYYHYQKMHNSVVVNQIIRRLRKSLGENISDTVPTHIDFKEKTLDNQVLYANCYINHESLLGKDPPNIIGTNLLDLIYRSVDNKERPTHGITQHELNSYREYSKIGELKPTRVF